MNDFFQQILLGIPVYVWILQFLYVAVALLILFAFVSVHERTILQIVLFVVVMIIVDVIWRIAIK